VLLCLHVGGRELRRVHDVLPCLPFSDLGSEYQDLVLCLKHHVRSCLLLPIGKFVFNPVIGMCASVVCSAHSDHDFPAVAEWREWLAYLA
jgi:hypothetical protein